MYVSFSLKKKLNLPRIQARPPCAPRVYKKLYGYLDSVLSLQKDREEKTRGSGGKRIPDDNAITPTKRKRDSGGPEARSSNDALGTPIRTPTTKTSGTKGRPTSNNKNDSQMRAAQLLQQQKQHNLFNNAIHGMSNKSRAVTEEPPEWTMPAIRRMCAALEIPKAAPHVYTGVRSVMAFEDARRNGNGEGKEDQRKKKKRTAENGAGKLKGVRKKRTVSGSDGNLDGTEDNIGGIDSSNDDSHNNSHRIDDTPEPGDAIAVSAQAASSPIAMTNESDDPGNSSSIENNIMALMASLLFYTLARMRGTDTSPEDFVRQRDVAVSALLSDGTTGRNLDTAATTTAGANTGDDDVDETISDRRSILLSQIERTMRAAQNGWLLLEWYQNIREGSYDTEWDEDVSDDDDDDDDKFNGNEDDYVSYNGYDNRIAYSEQNPRNPYYTPQKSRIRKDMAGPGSVDGLLSMRMRKTSTQQQQQKPVLCCTMMQYQIDYLSEGRRADFVRWKAGIMARIEEIEREKGHPGG